MALDKPRIERLLDSLIAASRGDYDQRVPLDDSEDDEEFLEVELGVNYLLDELQARRRQNEAQRAELIDQACQIAEQTAELVEALSTPILAVWPSVLVLPLIGRIDRKRANTINEVLLSRVSRDGVRYVILDLTGVETIEQGTVAAVLQMVRAIGLLGSKCAVTGIKPEAALQLVTTGEDSSSLRTYARISDALARVLADHRK